MSKQPNFLLTPGPMDAQQWGNTENVIERAGIIVPNKIELTKDSYAFKGFVGKSDALLQLEHLLGVGCVHGGCILVTGCRGAGKTSLVNRAIYEAGLLGRYDVKSTNEIDDQFRKLHFELSESQKVTLHTKNNSSALVT